MCNSPIEFQAVEDQVDTSFLFAIAIEVADVQLLTFVPGPGGHR